MFTTTFQGNFEEISNRPGLYKFELENPPCLPGEFRVLRWRLSRLPREGEIIGPVLGTFLRDGVAALLLINMKEDYYPRQLPVEELMWMGTSETRLKEDNRISDDPIEEGIITITLQRFQEEGYVQTQKKDGETIYFPTRALIMAMIHKRRALQGIT